MASETRTLYAPEELIYNKLIENGYPRSSIVIEGKLDARRYADFIVNDLDTGLPVMIIEVKFCDSRTIKHVEKVVYQYFKDILDKCKISAKLIAAIVNKETNEINFLDYTDAIKEYDIKSVIEDYSLPKYELLIQGSKSKVVKNREIDQKKRFNKLRIICWLILPLLCITLILLDVFSVYELTTNRLIVFGALSVFALIPCFKEITIGQISLKNAIEKQNEEKND